MFSLKCSVVFGGLLVAGVVGLYAEELPLPAEKQVVLETSYGDIVLEVFPKPRPTTSRSSSNE